MVVRTRVMENNHDKRRPPPPKPIKGSRVPDGWKLVPDRPSEEWITRMRARTSYAQVERAIEMMLSTAPEYEG